MTEPTLSNSGPSPLENRLEIVGFLLALTAVAVIISTLTQGWSIYREVNEFGGSTRWGEVLQFVALVVGNSWVLLVLPAAFLTVSLGGRSTAGPAGAAALWIVFVLGLGVAALALCATGYTMFSTVEGPMIFSTAMESPGIGERSGNAAVSLAGAGLSGFVSWCAFKDLPVSQASPRFDAMDGSDAIVDAEEA